MRCGLVAVVLALTTTSARGNAVGPIDMGHGDDAERAGATPEIPSGATSMTDPAAVTPPASGVEPGGDGEPRSTRSPVIAGVLTFGLPLITFPVLAIVDDREFESVGAENVAWQALGWSAIGLFVAAPTIGAVYAGDPWNTGTKLRVAAGTLFVLGVAVSLSEPNPSSTSFSFTRREALGVIAGGIGAIGYATGMIIEGVHSIRVAGRGRAPRTTVSAGALRGDRASLPALVVSGTW